MKKIIYGLSLLMISFVSGHAQQILSENEAVRIALRNNYDILVAENNAAINKANNTSGNAGMLPTVAINGTDNFSLNNTQQKYFNNTEASSNNASSNSFTSNIALNWTLFDGGKMFVTRKKLQEIEALGELQYKETVLQTVSDVILAYYNVVKQKQELASMNEVINYNLERVKILQTSFNAGNTAKTNLLQAQIDLNVYHENAITQKSVILASKKALNQLLSRDINLDFEVTDSIQTSYMPNTQDLLQKLYANNASIQALQKQVDVAKLSLKELQTLYLPKFSFNAGYNYLLSKNAVGNVKTNNSFGPQIGGTLSIPLYQSGNVKRQVSVSSIQLKSSEYGLETAKLALYTQLANALTQFEAQRNLLTIEKSNNTLTKENLDISIQRLRLGETTTLEAKQAQESYQDSLTRLLNFEYNLKAAETTLKQLLSETDLKL
ncbi:MAG: TolC family protein [Bacteroidota bacterium]|nr:TolC family protein [Bacteroidota bacterium]